VYTATCIFTNFSPHPNPNAHSSPKFDPNSNPALSWEEMWKLSQRLQKYIERTLKPSNYWTFGLSSCTQLVPVHGQDHQPI